MVRGLIVVLLVIGGAAGLAFGQHIRDEITAAMGEGSGVSGAMRTFVVSVSPAHHAQVDAYRSTARESTWLGAVVFGIGVGIGIGATGRGSGQRGRAGGAGSPRTGRSAA